MAATATQTVEQFLAALAPERRREMECVRDLIRKNIPDGYEEAVVGRMIAYQVPLKTYPDTYNGHALWFAALASEKNIMSLHLMPLYMNDAKTKRVQEAFKSAGKKLDMGKACIRFKAADDLALDAIKEVVAGTPIDEWIATAKAARRKK